MNPASVVREFAAFAYDKLVYFDADGQPLPWLAESWEETATSVQYVLKDGITCSDGTALTASVVAANFEFVEDPQNASPMRGTLVPDGVTVTADDDARTVLLEYEQPNSFLLNQTGTLDILCQNALDDPGSVDNTTDGTGLFVLTEALPGDRYVLERRDDYDWSFDDTTSETPGVPKTVTVRLFNSPSTLANSILSGEVNVGRVTGPDMDRMEAANLASVSSELQIGQFWFNQSEVQPTSELSVRQALIGALDLNALSTTYTGGRGALPTSALSGQPRPCTYDSVSSLPSYDVDAAADLLEQSGWALGADGVRSKDGNPLEISLLYENSTDGMKAAAELAEQQWSAIGAKVNLLGGDEAYTIDLGIGRDDPETWSVNWIPVQSDVPSLFIPLASGPAPTDGLNFSRVETPNYLERAAEASQLAGAESCDAWQKAEEALVENITLVPFAVDQNRYFFNGATTTVDLPITAGAVVRLIG